MPGFRAEGDGDDQESGVRNQKKGTTGGALFFCLLTSEFFTEDDTKMFLQPAVNACANRRHRHRRGKERVRYGHHRQSILDRRRTGRHFHARRLHRSAGPWTVEPQ